MRKTDKVKKVKYVRSIDATRRIRVQTIRTCRKDLDQKDETIDTAVRQCAMVKRVKIYFKADTTAMQRQQLITNML